MPGRNVPLIYLVFCFQDWYADEFWSTSTTASRTTGTLYTSLKARHECTAVAFECQCMSLSFIDVSFLWVLSKSDSPIHRDHDCRAEIRISWRGDWEITTLTPQTIRFVCECIYSNEYRFLLCSHAYLLPPTAGGDASITTTTFRFWGVCGLLGQ